MLTTKHAEVATLPFEKSLQASSANKLKRATRHATERLNPRSLRPQPFIFYKILISVRHARHVRRP